MLPRADEAKLSLVRQLLLLSAIGITGCATSTASAPSAGEMPVPVRSAAESDLGLRIPVGDSPTRGPAAAPVRIIEFGDFESAPSAEAHQTMNALHEAYPTQIQFVYKHRPLPRHRAARGAARAAVAAQNQGRFWEYAARLFANPTALAAPQLRAYATELGLDAEKLDDDAQSAVVKAQVYADDALAGKVGVTTAPTFFVNGRRVSGATSEPDFRRLIDTELEKAALLQSRGLRAPNMADVLTALNLRTGATEAQPVPSPTAAAPKKRSRPAEDPSVIYPVRYSDEHLAVGASATDTLVTMVVFNDYQCAFCRRLESTLSALQKKHPQELRVIYRHQPLPMHTEAKLAAEAAHAAGDQGKYREAHTLFFENMRQLQRADLVRHAYALGIDPVRFERALDDGRFRGLVEADMADAKRLGVTGTPTIFVNGRKIRGAKAASHFEKVIAEELIRARAIAKKTGLNGAALYRELVGLPPNR